MAASQARANESNLEVGGSFLGGWRDGKVKVNLLLALAREQDAKNAEETRKRRKIAELQRQTATSKQMQKEMNVYSLIIQMELLVQ